MGHKANVKIFKRKHEEMRHLAWSYYAKVLITIVVYQGALVRVKNN